MRAPYIWLLALVAGGVPCVQADSAAPGIAVLDFELRDLTLDPGNAAEIERTRSIKPMLEDELSHVGYRIVAVGAQEQQAADAGAGYLFDHPEAAAELAKAAGADYIVVGRLHKASFLFVYLKAHVVDVASSALIADLVVEVKGPQKELTARGVASLAAQIGAALPQRSR